MNNPNVSDKYKQLSKIRNAVEISQTRHLGPRSGLAVVVAVGSTVLAYVASAQLDARSLPGALCVGLVAWFVTYRLARNLPRTNIERLDELLAQYEPVDLVAFQALQEDVRTRGTYSFDQLRVWIHWEQQAIQARVGEPKPLDSKFLDRQL